WGVTADRDKATLVAGRCGQVVGALLIATGLYRLAGGDLGPLNNYSGIFGAFIGWMIVSAATAAIRDISMRTSLDGTTAAELMWDRPLAVHPDESLARVSWMFPDAPYPAFPVVDDHGRVVGILSVS